MTHDPTGWRTRAGSLFDTEKLPAHGARGMVVTNNPLGSTAGAEMLAAGGNAVDAAVASLFALTVVEPMMVGIFGAGMSTIRMVDGTRACINNYATAPAAARADMYRCLSNTWPDYQNVAESENDVGPLAVAVPGSLRGWCDMLALYGRFALADVVQPAIRFARNGFLVTQYLHDIVRQVAHDMARFPETARTFLPDGVPLPAGARIVQNEYADVLETIAREGPDVLYGGALGGLATDYLQSVGGLITLDNLRGYRTAHSEGVTGNYRGCRIIGPAPPSAGGVHVVEMLNILEGFDIAAMGFGTADSLHLIAEALKLGFEDRREFMGDPAFVDVPMARLTSAEHAAERRALVSLKSARDVDMSYDAESNHTTHLTTADADGNVVAATHTLHAPFGSKLTVPGTGMLLNNTMNIFDPHPGLANSIAPGKRMTSSMSPVIVERKGRAWFALGSVGGTRIFPSVFQAIVNVIDFGMSAQESVEAPRIWTLGEDLDVEHAVADDVRTELARRGHRVVPHQVIGAGMGMIMFDQDTMTGASCWRADGTPVALGGGMARAGVRLDF